MGRGFDKPISATDRSQKPSGKMSATCTWQRKHLTMHRDRWGTCNSRCTWVQAQMLRSKIHKINLQLHMAKLNKFQRTEIWSANMCRAVRVTRSTRGGTTHVGQRYTWLPAGGQCHRYCPAEIMQMFSDQNAIKPEIKSQSWENSSM